MITEGMTTEEFIAALNTDFAGYWGTGGVSDITDADGYVAAINTNFGETVAAFGQRGSTFINAINNKINTFTNALEDDCEASDIDTSKWTITNALPTHFQFEQSQTVTDKKNSSTWVENSLALVMHTLLSLFLTDYFLNEVRSVESLTHGAVRMSVLNIFHVANYVKVGLANSDNTNRIELYTEADTSLSLGIFKNSVEVYTVEDVFKDFGEVKFVITPTNKISVYLWTDDAWVQLGATQTQDLGELKIFMTARGATGGQTSIRDVYITSRDFSTVIPGVSDSARIYGEDPDGTTDNAATINAALVDGDVTLEHGTFLFSESIKIPSNRTLNFKNAKILMGDASYDNSFRNLDFDGGNVNVKVKGLGHAVLDCNAANNNDQYVTYSDLTPPETVDGNWEDWTEEGYHYVNILFCNVVGFEINGIKMVDYPHWNIVCQFASEGIIKNSFINYYTTTTPSNQDGIDVNWGCDDIQIYNIRSTTDDDFSYCGCGRSDYCIPKVGPAKVGNVTNINYHDITVYGSGGRCLILVTSEGNVLNGIWWNNIAQYSAYYNVLFGWPDYDIVPPTAEEFKNIIIDAITVNANAETSIFKVNEDCKNITITNVTNNSEKDLIAFTEGVETENITIDGTPYP